MYDDIDDDRDDLKKPVYKWSFVDYVGMSFVTGGVALIVYSYYLIAIGADHDHAKCIEREAARINAAAKVKSK